MGEIRITKVLEPKIKKVRELDEEAMGDLEEYPLTKEHEDIPVYDKEEEEFLEDMGEVPQEERDESEDEKDKRCAHHHSI